MGEREPVGAAPVAAERVQVRVLVVGVRPATGHVLAALPGARSGGDHAHVFQTELLAEVRLEGVDGEGIARRGGFESELPRPGGGGGGGGGGGLSSFGSGWRDYYWFLFRKPRR